MTNKMIVLFADGRVVEEEKHSRVLLTELQAAVGGYIEVVPGFHTYEGNACVVYCDEEGKLKDKPVNATASQAWEDALGMFIGDVLVGDIVVLVGDDRFLA